MSTKMFLILLSVIFSTTLAVAQAPPPPTNLVVTPQCAMEKLTWTSSPGATGYTIWRGTTPGGTFVKVGEKQGSAAIISYIDIALALNYSTTYYYYVVATNSSGESSPSTTASAATLPALFTVTPNRFGTWIKLAWPSYVGNLTVYRATSPSGPFTNIAIIGVIGSTAGYTDKTATYGSTYHYRLFNTVKGWVSGAGGNSCSISPGPLKVPFQITPNPPFGVLPDALILPGWAEQTMPSDSSNAPSGGPSSAIRVELANGVTATGAPGVVALNPDGSDFGFSLQYRTALAAGNVASAGLPTGWSHNWDIRILQDGTQTGWAKSFRLVYPSGASEVLTPDLDPNGNPLDTFTAPIGAPYIVKGVHSTGSTGIWDSLTISGNGLAKQVFTQAVDDPFYRLTSQIGSNGTSTLYFLYLDGKLTQINNGRFDSFATRITISYNNSDGIISKAATSGQNFIDNFVRNYTIVSGNLTAASRLNLTASEWTYGYAVMNGQPYLSTVGSLTPTGTTASAIVGYDSDTGQANGVTDAIGNLRAYNYNVSEDGGVTTTPGARTTTIKDGVGNTFDVNLVVCDEKGRETVSKDRLGAPTTIAYGASSDPSAVTQVQPPIGNSSLAEYDSHGNLTKTTAPYGNYTIYTWEYPTIAPLGRTIKVQEFGNDNGATSKSPTTYTYYAIGEQNYFNDPTNSGPEGYLRKITFPNGGFLKYYYAVNGNVMGVSGIENYTYNYVLPNNLTLMGRPTSVTDANFQPTDFAYDANLRLMSVTDPMGISVSAEYNEYGQLKKTYLPGSKSINIAFGVNGRAANAATLSTPQGSTTLYTNTYNSESVLATSKNGLNITESQSPNPALGLSSVTNGNSQPMHLFTPDTNLRTVDYRIGNGTNAVGFKTTFNAVGNAISTKQTLPSVADIGTANYRSDDPDMLNSSSSSNTSTFAANFDTSYTYDVFGRVITAQSTGTGTGATYLDPAPYVATHIYTYDNEDHVLTDNNIVYTYNTNGTLNTMTVRSLSGMYVRYSYTYDSKLRTTEVKADKVDFQGTTLQFLTKANYVYDNSDRVTYVWTANGVTKYVYDSESRISALYNLRSDSSAPPLYQIPVDLLGGGTGTRAVLSSFTNITYDKFNNRTGMSIALATTTGNPTVYKTGTATFGYDEASRLTSESWTGEIVGGTAVSYTHVYDNADNLTTLRSGGLTVDPASDLLTTSGYSFNTFGDCETWGNIAVNGTSSTLNASQGWDPVGQLNRVSGPTAVTNSFNSVVTQQMAYDDQGRRASSRVYGYKIQASGEPLPYTDGYTYSGSDLVMRTSKGTVTFVGGSKITVGNDFSERATVFYVVGPTGPVIEFDEDGAKADLTYDPQGSCVASNKGGPLFLSPWMLYDGYGKPVAKHPSMTIDEASRVALNQPLQYKGQFGYIADGHTGAYYCTHRFYDPNTGRWLSRDPIGLEGGTNTFSYCGGNPVMCADPSGLDWEFLGFAFSVDGTLNGVKTGVCAVAHVFSFNTYENQWAKTQPGYDGSVLCATVSREALLEIGGAKVLQGAGKAWQAVASTRAGTKFRVVVTTASLKAVTKYKSMGGVTLTAKQTAALSKNPQLAAAFKGTQLDKAVKEVVNTNRFFTDFLKLESSPAFKFGPDFVMRGSNVWWDITTKGQWAKHISKYGPTFGKGTHILNKIK